MRRLVNALLQLNLQEAIPPLSFLSLFLVTLLYIL